ncbi:MAG: alpha/beta hydrolase [Gemmatimonadaceae bacterium]|nr:alpha/beta hydrolase [Gemmatimonadaceae bacterium]
MSDAIARFQAWRRSLPRPPRLQPFEITVRGLRFAVWRTPEHDGMRGKVPLCCINGGLLFDHRLLWPALSPLAATRPLIFYDQRGRGRTQAPPGPRAARIEHDAGDVVALRQALGLDRWDLLGHSWGGGIAMLAADSDAAATRRLVLLNPVGTHADPWLPSLTERALPRLTSVQQFELRAAHARTRPGAPTAADPDALSDYARAIYPAWFADTTLATLFNPPRSTSITGAAVSARLRAEGYDWRPRLGHRIGPALILHGVDDLIPVEVARETAAVLGRDTTRLQLVPGAGHNPFWEAPSIVFPAIDRFLDAEEPLEPPAPTP